MSRVKSALHTELSVLDSAGQTGHQIFIHIEFEIKFSQRHHQQASNSSIRWDNTVSFGERLTVIYRELKSGETRLD